MSDDIAQMIEDCEARDSKLSEWGQQFIDSIGRQLAKNGSLEQERLMLEQKLWRDAQCSP